MSWLSRLLGGDKPHTPRSQLHRLGWPEPATAETERLESPRPSIVESPETAAERERAIRQNRRPDKPAQRGRRQRKRK